jgi:hypothetical protein
MSSPATGQHRRVRWFIGWAITGVKSSRTSSGTGRGIRAAGPRARRGASRIDTIVNFDAEARYGVKAEGSAAAASASVLAELAGLIVTGELELPIAATFPLDRVQDAYRRRQFAGPATGIARRPAHVAQRR